MGSRARVVGEIERPAPLGSLLASARRLTSADLKAKRRRSTTAAESSWQSESWDMYDLVGEQHFLVSNLAKRLGKARLYVGKVNPLDPTDDPFPVVDEKIKDVLQAVGGSQAALGQLLERLAMNLSMAGEGWMVGIPEHLLDEEAEAPKDPDSIPLTDFEWRMLSVSEVQTNTTGKVTLQLDLNQKLEVEPEDVYLIRVWRPHPRWWWQADSPSKAALPVLKELVGLTMHIGAQVDSRLAGAGVFIVPQSAQRALRIAAGVPEDSEEDQFTEALIEAMMTSISDRSNASALVPLVVTVPDESTGLFRHITFSTPLDAEARNLRDEAIRRLALGQDAPPELLLGSGGMNHWGAWLTQEDTVANHIEPPLALICDALTTQYLWPVLEGMGVKDYQDHVIWYDVNHLIIHHTRTGDAKDLHTKGVISDEALRRETGFDESDAPDTEDPVKEMILEMIKGNPGMLRSSALEEMITRLKAIVEGRPLNQETLPDDTGAEQAPAAPGESAQSPTPSLIPQTANDAPPLAASGSLFEEEFDAALP